MQNPAFAVPHHRCHQQQQQSQIHQAYDLTQPHQVLHDASTFYAYPSTHHPDYAGRPPSSACHHYPYPQWLPPPPPPWADREAATAPETLLNGYASHDPNWDHRHLALTQFQHGAEVGVGFPASGRAVAPSQHPRVCIESSHRGRGRRGPWPFRGGSGRGNFGGHSEAALTLHGRGQGCKDRDNNMPNHISTPEAASTSVTKSLLIMEPTIEEPQPETMIPRRPILQHAWCDICRVDCNSLGILEQHKNGKQHKKTVKILQRMQAQQTLMVDLRAKNGAKPEIVLQSCEDDNNSFLDKGNKLSQVGAETIAASGQIIAPSFSSDQICEAEKEVVPGNVTPISSAACAASIASENLLTATIEMDYKVKPYMQSQTVMTQAESREGKAGGIAVSGNTTPSSAQSQTVMTPAESKNGNAGDVAVSGNITLSSAQISEANKSFTSSVPLASSETNEAYTGLVASENVPTETIEMDFKKEPDIQSQTITAQAETKEWNAGDPPEYIDVPVAERRERMNGYGKRRGSKRKMIRYWQDGKQLKRHSAAGIPASKPHENQKTETMVPRRPILQHAWCDICRVGCNSLGILEQHKNGKQHKKAVKRLQRMQAQQTLMVDLRAKNGAKPEIVLQSCEDDNNSFLDKENKLSQVGAETIAASGQIIAPSFSSDQICEAEKAVVPGNVTPISSAACAASIASENLLTATIEMDYKMKPYMQSQTVMTQAESREGKAGGIAVSGNTTPSSAQSQTVMTPAESKNGNAGDVAVPGNITLSSAQISEANKSFTSSVPLASYETNETYTGLVASENVPTETIEMDFKKEPDIQSQTITAQAETKEWNAGDAPEYIDVPVAERRERMNGYGKRRGSKRKMIRYWRDGKQLKRHNAAGTTSHENQKGNGKQSMRLAAVDGRPKKHQKERPRVCTLCNATCEALSVFESHLSGRKHISRIKQFQSENVVFGPISVYIPTNQPTACPQQTPEPLFFGLTSHEILQEVACAKGYGLQLSGQVEQAGAGNLVSESSSI